MKSIISHITLPKFEYFTPLTVDDALSLLEQHQNSAQLLAGGTDLIIELRQRLKKPKVIIDLKKIPDLRNLNITVDSLEIGATTPINEILAVPEVKMSYTALYQSLSDLADEILRYRATIGGNICTASPAADTACALIVLQAEVHISSRSRGIRTVSIQNFFTGVKKNCLSSDEIVTKIVIPKPPEGTQSGFKKMKRSSEDLALVGIAGLHNQKFTFLSFTAVAPIPIFVDVSTFFTSSDSKLTEERFGAVWKEILPHLNPISDVRSSKEYRIHISEILTRDLLRTLIK
jgi:CO/xanthine dehydrogenase FAD-binding subunit